MTISKKLYFNFGAILAIVVILCLVNIVAVRREHAARDSAASAWDLAHASGDIRNQMMANRQYLNNYLLSGDSREISNFSDGTSRVQDLIRSAGEKAPTEDQREAFAKLAEAERGWQEGFAHPLMDKRKEVDSGSATVSDLQIQYLQLNPGSWTKSSTVFIDQVDALSNKQLEEQRKSDNTAGNYTMAIAILGTLIALGLGGFIAFRTAQSITDPLNHLMGVAREIGQSGDLDHQIDVSRTDEIGELSRSFANMVAYIREMSQVSKPSLVATWRSRA